MIPWICAALGSGCYVGARGRAVDEGEVAESDGGGFVPDDDGVTTADLPDPAGTGGDEPMPFTPMPPVSALAKVKDFVVGQPPTEVERQAYLADPTILRAMIDGWMATDEYEPRAIEIFTSLFQQDPSFESLAEYLKLSNGVIAQMDELSGRRLMRSIPEGFAHTAFATVREGRPFHEVITTRTFMLNVPHMVLLAYLDATPRDDLAMPMTSPVLTRHPTFTTRFSYTGQAIPLTQSLDPNSPNFMHFWIEDLVNPSPSCTELLDKEYAAAYGMQITLYMLFRYAPGGKGCVNVPEIFTDEDWQLRPVTIRTPNVGEDTHEFFDLDTLRASDELVLSAERVGFFTTLGFSGSWITNDSNQHRVNANQALIVALGRTFDPVESFTPADGASVDQDHAQPGTPCYVCHQNLDPLRDFLRQSQTYWGAARPAEQLADLPATAYFSIDGSEPVAGFGVGDLANAMAASERFAPAWAERLCYLLNAGSCDPEDPELARVAQAFADSGYDWNTLVRELLVSPIVTFAERTSTSDAFGEVSPPVDRDRFCRRLSVRLGIPDACNLESRLDAPAAAATSIRALANGVPPVSFGRSAVVPFVVSEPDVFSVAAIENICRHIAEEFLGDQVGAVYRPAEREQVLDLLVAGLMAIPSGDPRYAEIRALLAEHWDEAVQFGSSEEIALRSTFVAGCSSAPVAAASL